jgi:hypothetical protein
MISNLYLNGSAPKKRSVSRTLLNLKPIEFRQDFKLRSMRSILTIFTDKIDLIPKLSHSIISNIKN